MHVRQRIILRWMGSGRHADVWIIVDEVAFRSSGFGPITG